MTNFIARAHKCLIDEFPYTRAGPFERFLKWQRINAPELLAKDEVLQCAIDKMGSQDLNRASNEAAQHHRTPPKLLRR